MSDTQPNPEPQPAYGTSVMPPGENGVSAMDAGPDALFGGPEPVFEQAFEPVFEPAFEPAFEPGYGTPEPAFGADLPPAFGAGLPADGPRPMVIEDGEEDDGLPGGPTPASSGFSWRLPGTPAPAPVAQGGIPNEFDHLFRDSGADSRRSLMPGQAPIGVGVPGRGEPAPQVPGQASSGYPGGVYQSPDGYQLPTYQQPEYPQPEYQQSEYQQGGRSQDGYPQQPYLTETGPMYDPAGQATSQVPVGAPDEAHTQTIPRVPVQYGGGGQGGPDLLTGTGPNRSSANRTLAIAVGVLAVLVVIAMFAFSGGGSSKGKANPAADADTPTVSAPAGVDPAAKAQADAIYAVMQQSQGLTSKANGAITDVSKCSNVQQAVQTFTDVAAKRQAQADAISALPADKLADGSQLVSHLQQAWQASATSESELAAWAQDNVTCSGKPGNNDNRKHADTDGGKAGSLKTSAADEWNAIAAKTGEPSVKHTDL